MKILLFANTDWYIFNFRRSLAVALRDAGHDVLIAAPAGDYARRLEDLGFRVFRAPLGRRSLNPILEIRVVAWLWSLLRREQVDIVHGFTTKCVVYSSIAGRLAALIRGRPARVNSVTGMGYVFSSTDLTAKILRPLVNVLFRGSLSSSGSHVILQNRDDLEFFVRELAVPESRISLIPGSGVDLARFLPVDFPKPVDDTTKPVRIRVLLAARLLWDKGVGEFVEAGRLIRSRRSDIELLLAGVPDAGNPAAVDDEHVQRWHRERVVTWLGHVEDMPTLYRQVDIAVLPSYREGLPKALIEAAAVGLPLITTDAPGCRDLVTDGVEGLLVPVRDANALAAAIEKLCDDASLRSQLGKAARQRAVRDFNDQTINGQTIAVYERLFGPERCAD